MMTAVRSSPVWAISVLMFCSSSAMAQFGDRIDRPMNAPPLSPYLNLFRNNDSGFGMNYFGLVRPQLEFAEQNQQLGQSLQMVQMQQLQGFSGMPTGGYYSYSQLGTTGHPVMFNSFRMSQFGGGYSGGTAGFGGSAAGTGFAAGTAGYSNQGLPSAAGRGGWQSPAAYGPACIGTSGHSASFGNIVPPGTFNSGGR